MNDDHCLKQLKDLGVLISDAMRNEKSCLYEKNSGEINLLIGANYARKLLTGNIKHFSRGLVAVNTLLGSTVMGASDIKGKSTNNSLLVLSLHVNDAKITDLWKLDTLSIQDSNEKHSKTETQQFALKHFRETVCRDNIGRYKVNLPWTSKWTPSFT
ncbi:uncharacterized protein NPIL_497491 [Nephila pilipes]|uniref:Uncharacterized protein n=1 Tax=Nephila pilipes TaxID=299642 RepID=A0A8X6UNJ6_NEPPI|nr:uncharacterized protein NPIL_497491 [Nephila pilipes]